MPTLSKSARLMTLALVTILTGASAFASEQAVQEVPLERYTSYPSISPTAETGQEQAAPKSVYQNGMMFPMNYSPTMNITYAPQYTVKGNGSSIIASPFPMGGMPAQTGAVPQQQAQPAPQVPMGAPAKDDSQKEPETPTQGEGQDQGTPAPETPQEPTVPSVASDDASEFSKRAKISIKGHVTMHVNSIRAGTIMKDFGDTLQRTETVWGVGPDGKRTNDFRTIITFFEAKKGPHGVRACKTITNGKLVRNAEKKVMEVVLEPTETPKYCVAFKDGKRTRISALDGSILAGEAREDAVPAEEPVKEEPKEAPKAQAQVEAPRQDAPNGAK